MYRTLAFVWKFLPQAVRWWLLWLTNPKVVVGVSGVVLNDRNEILLLRHRFHPRWPWGLPGGLLNRGERLVDGWQREVREETNYEIVAESIVVQRSTALTFEFILKGRIVGGVERLDGTEILESGFFAPDDLPAGLHSDHLEAIRLVFQAEEQLVPLPSSEQRPLTNEPIL